MPTPFRVACYLPRALIASALVLLALGTSPVRAVAEDVKLTAEQARNLGIRVTHPVPSPTDKTLPYPAQIVIPTPQLWVVSAPVAGMVTNLAVGRGDRVTTGQPLLTLESPSFVSLQREYLHALAQEVLAAQQLKRNADLFDGKAVPQRVLESSQAEARQASIVVAERRQMLHLSGLSDDAIARLTNEAAISATLTVNAPQAASVVEIAVSPGQRMEQSAPLVKLARLSPLWVEIAIPATNIGAIKIGAKVEIDGYPTPGRVILVSETTDAATQTILVRAEIPNNGELHSGQTAAARIGFISAGESAWEIPYSGLVRRGEQTSIFVAIEGGFRQVPVTLLAEDQDHVVVSGPITEQNDVAVGGISALRGILLRLGQ
ncbi:MAG: efflux RND transporter periplasmic adaptor subunit [Bradyrhizobium sp.]|jgi:RND family efflux transporter MFP subunit|uniref:Efflux RND transporter periplasmic adaptor subunit n=4 Tax=Bradyrhizobium TaxID=374 RepID=A0ABS5GF65_9BRAD|nr:MULTISPECIES: efflux RND transporter periplasmic adaptor subunit [Bradyrhizobium]RTL98350.1 MAG: efflux RND transporter periplasmic adaptor subunit [Bradyrhizobiaceae bacterium]MBR1139992.1 efflux RND transporter periplasmic adaptor subunit [Bradyrhizobium denitrificans]MDU0960008.1 efflux RND transporter periplasmic adaptor subunit [Bradyrhizobium sp.]MDU1495874.1 efflux RND transporter periplasmic adaptor subunit [Bradyrhizobium sp.]MDU1546025.1 efflux RND transporter periplasmic adaptor 